MNLAVSWRMLENIENLYDIEGLHSESPWICPKFKVTFDASVIWRLIGLERLFGSKGFYRNLVCMAVGDPTMMFMRRCGVDVDDGSGGGGLLSGNGGWLSDVGGSRVFTNLVVALKLSPPPWPTIVVGVLEIGYIAFLLTLVSGYSGY